jgi:hypothetical protein
MIVNQNCFQAPAKKNGVQPSISIFAFMRLWSIHPGYLDSKGLVALWREALLAKNVLENKTKGYKNHPQLQRFKKSSDPLRCIQLYLAEIYKEAEKRKFTFDKNKFENNFEPMTLEVTRGQLNFEINHLKRKLKGRDAKKLKEIMLIKEIEPHPLFKIIDGETESWEII